jgi:cell division protease FtsH
MAFWKKKKKGSPRKKKAGWFQNGSLSQGTLIGAIIGAAFAIINMLFLSDAPDAPLAWPYANIETAEEVSFSDASRAMKEGGTGLRIAILPAEILIETALPPVGPQPGDPGDPPGTVVKGKVLKTEVPVAFRDAFFTQNLVSPDYDVAFFYPEDNLGGFSIDLLISILFLLLFGGLVLKMIMGSGSFGTDKGFDIIKNTDLEKGLDDVAGLESARTTIQDIIGLLKDDGKASIAGGRLPRGLLLDGPPGNGKTLIAKAMAKDAGVSFISMQASSVNQMFVGLGSMKIKKVFRMARKMAPCIIFIDEIDAIGRKRGGGSANDAGSRESDNSLNALLTEMDGFGDQSGIFVVAATNRPEILDPALTRPGRIDLKVTITLPDLKARGAILAVHSKGKTLADDVDLQMIGASAYGASGADLENLVNKAALLAGKDGRSVIAMADFRAARDQMLLPQSGRSTELQADEKYLTAVHEAGHAMIALLSPHADPVEKITIAPQGPAAGFVLQFPDRDRVFETKARLLARLEVCVAGREAERIFLGDEMVTTGAASDIQQATRIARAMVMQYGMSDLGFLEFDVNDPALIDVNNPPSRMIKGLIDDAIANAASTLEAHRPAMDLLIKALMARETLTGVEAKTVITSPSRITVKKLPNAGLGWPSVA